MLPALHVPAPDLGPRLLEASAIVLQSEVQSRRPATSPEESAAFGLLATLVVGGLLLSARPGYVNRAIRDVQDHPIGCFLWGLLGVAVVVVVAVFLVLSVVGVVLLIPLLLLVLVAGVAGNVVGFGAIFSPFVEDRWVWLGLAALAVAMTGLLPVVGGLVGLVVGGAGFGAVIREWMAH